MTSNVNQVIQDFNRLNESLQKIVKQEIEKAGRQAEFDAKQNAPVDTGKHRQSITYESTNNGLGAAISANEAYSPYLEFGTGTSVDIPDGFEDLAIQFKGKGKRQINMKAQPHIIPAAKKAHSDLVDNIEIALNRL